MDRASNWTPAARLKTMNNVHPFQCPYCKSKKGLLRLPREPKTEDDLRGAVCANCGHAISEEDIKRSAIALVDALVKKIKLD